MAQLQGIRDTGRLESSVHTNTPMFPGNLADKCLLDILDLTEP